VFEYGHLIAIYEHICFLKLDIEVTDIGSIQAENIFVILGLRALEILYLNTVSGLSCFIVGVWKQLCR